MTVQWLRLLLWSFNKISFNSICSLQFCATITSYQPPVSISGDEFQVKQHTRDQYLVMLVLKFQLYWNFDKYYFRPTQNFLFSLYSSDCCVLALLGCPVLRVFHSKCVLYKNGLDLHHIFCPHKMKIPKRKIFKMLALSFTY